MRVSGRHAAAGRTNERSRTSAFFGARVRGRTCDLAAALCGVGVALTGTELGGTAGTGLAIAGVGLPTAWLAWGAGRTRRKLETEQALRRRAATMATAQDSRIQALRQRLRSIDAAQAQHRGDLALAQSGLLTTRVELAAMRANLAATRHDLSAARTDLVEMREQLAAVLVSRHSSDRQLVLATDGHDVGSAQRLILPPGMVLPARVDAFAGADRQVFDAFAQADAKGRVGADDMATLISVPAMVPGAHLGAPEDPEDEVTAA